MYRETLYAKYGSTHTGPIYGAASVAAIEGQFIVWRKYYARFLPENKEARICDLGCGNGGFVHFLQTLGYRNVSGIDISGEEIGKARQMGIENIIHADLKEFLEDKTEQYDVIFARDVIEHFEKEEVFAVLKLIFSSLKQEGMVIIQAPNAESPFGGRYRYGDFTHETAFTVNSLNQTLRATGFRDIACYPTGPVPHGLKSAVRYLLWMVIDMGLRMYVLIETGSGKGIFTQTLICKATK